MDGYTEDLMGIEPVADKLKSLKWGVKMVDGHDYAQLLETLNQLPIEPGKPSAIIADTVKGKGVSFMERRNKWHYGSPSDEQFQQALKELEA